MSLIFREFSQLRLAVAHAIAEAPDLDAAKDEVHDLMADFAEQIDMMAEHSAQRPATRQGLDPDWEEDL